MERKKPGADFRLDWFGGIAIPPPPSAVPPAGRHGAASSGNGGAGGLAAERGALHRLAALAGDDTSDWLARLCARARQPVDAAHLAALEVGI